MPFNANEHHDSVEGEDFTDYEWEGYLLYIDNTQRLATKARFEDEDRACKMAKSLAKEMRRPIRVCQETWPLITSYEPKDVGSSVPPGEPFDDCLSSDVVETFYPDEE